MSEKEYGSGHFGEWIEDEYGNPAYKYTCDQTKDPLAVSPTNPTWRASTEQSFQIGNDRITAVASNYGYLQVRQDEGTPKFLNDYNPESSSFGAGIGYLTDGDTVISTYYTGDNYSFDRVYGTGYMRKAVEEGGYEVTHTIFAPYGDDPVLISKVTIKNNKNERADLRWLEYWGNRAYQFSFRALLMSYSGSNLDTLINNEADKLRRSMEGHFTHSYNYLKEKNTVLEEKHFCGWAPGEKETWDYIKNKYRSAVELTGNNSLYGSEIEDMEDLNPPSTFLASLSAPLSGLCTDSGWFFGKGGVSKPDGIKSSLEAPVKCDSGSAMIAQISFSIESGESKTFYFLYGYLTEGFTVEKLIEKYEKNVETLLERSSMQWKENRISMAIPGEKWVDRELMWHNCYLRGNLTYDSYFKEHILSQGHIYQYIMGFQGAARDPLQHVMPFIFNDFSIVKEIIRYTLKEVLPDGEIPYGFTGHGAIMISPILPSDSELWLLWTAAEYVLASKDKEFLNEMVEPYPFKGIRQEKKTVLELLYRCYEHFINNTGTGKHGLSKILNGDWNDNIVVGSITEEQHREIRENGESVLVAAMASHVLDRFGKVLESAGEAEKAAGAFENAEKQREAVRQQWNGKWFRRAYLTEELGWVGDELLWLEPQPWAIIGGAALDWQKKILVDSINKNVRKPSPIGAVISSGCPEQMKLPKGTVTNGGIWPSINGTLILALSRCDKALAWDEWRKNTLANHADRYPDIWAGIWSGPDAYNSILAEYPGNTHFETDPEKREKILNWTDFPVLNMHPHAWTLYNMAMLFVDEFTSDGIKLDLGFPEKAYKFSSPLLGVKKENGTFSGWYAPAEEGSWKLTFRINPDDMSNFKICVINGEEKPLVKDGCEISVVGKSSPGKPLSWMLK